MKHSDSLYTIEDDPLNKPSRPKSLRWIKWGLATIAAVFFVYHSMRPVMRLRADPPPSFYDHSLTRTKEDRQRERQVAQDYWKVAVQQIQGRYRPKSQLPIDPPPSFRISDATRSLEEEVATSRIHYWTKLREVWRQSSAWNVTYRWDTGWVENWLNSLGQEAPQWVSNVFQTIANWFNAIAQQIPFS